MLQLTLERVKGLQDKAFPPILICNNNHRFLVAEQLRSIDAGPAEIILEPVGKNTAPAVAIAALHALELHDDPNLLVLPADHIIKDVPSFLESVQHGATLAEQGHLITFGIVPDRPETGFGYIKKGNPLVTGSPSFMVDHFVEKPDTEKAQEYIDSENYLWNSGMFMFKASRYIEELQRYSPEIIQCTTQAHAKRESDLDFIRLDKKAFTRSPADSIDYAVMEKTDDAVVIPLDCDWSDVGSWSALWEIGEQDNNGNLIHGNVLTHDVSNSYLHSTNRLIAAVGLDEHVVVETTDAVLVAPKTHVQDVKEIVDQLKAADRDEALLHRRVYRPWGSYECIDCADRFQVKRIIVKPQASLSLQMHRHRAEHWIIVKGSAKITNGEETTYLTENQSTYIPVGVKHRLENPGPAPLELIEVQSGSYFGEDDIVRFEDLYGRTDET